MRILLVSHKFPPSSLGGVEVYTRHLAQALAEKHEVCVFFRDDVPGDSVLSERDAAAGSVRLRSISFQPRGAGAWVGGEFWNTFRNAAIEASFARVVKHFRPELIHVQHVMNLSARLLTLAHAAGVPVLLTLHDYWFLCANSQLLWPDGRVCRGKAWGMNCVLCAGAARYPSRAIRLLRPALAPLFLYRDRVVKRAALSVDHFVSPSRFLIDRYTSSGFPRDRFTFLENGIPAREIAEQPRRPGNRALRVAFLGALAWQKGVHLLAEAWRRLPPGFGRLRIWGDPSLFPEYSARVRTLLDGTGAEMMGGYPNRQVGEVLADSDVVVVPSLWYENSPVVIQEARAAGVPVVASGHGALAEKVRDGVDGLLFPPGDVDALRGALLRLGEEPGLLARLQREVPPAMDLAEHVNELERIYDQAHHSDPLP